MVRYLFGLALLLFAVTLQFATIYPFWSGFVIRGVFACAALIVLWVDLSRREKRWDAWVSPRQLLPMTVALIALAWSFVQFVSEAL